jgi:hypothetical protein
MLQRTRLSWNIFGNTEMGDKDGHRWMYWGGGGSQCHIAKGIGMKIASVHRTAHGLGVLIPLVTSAWYGIQICFLVALFQNVCTTETLSLVSDIWWMPRHEQASHRSRGLNGRTSLLSTPPPLHGKCYRVVRHFWPWHRLTVHQNTYRQRIKAPFRRHLWRLSSNVTVSAEPRFKSNWLLFPSEFTWPHTFFVVLVFNWAPSHEDVLGE